MKFNQLAPTLITLVATWMAPYVQPIAQAQHLVDWCRKVDIKEGDFQGPFDPERHAAQYYTIKAIGDALLGIGPFRHFAVRKVTQDGGTLAAHVIPQVYTAGVLHDPVCTGHPDMALAGKHWRGKFRPVVESIDPSWLPSSGQGSENSARVDEVLINTTPTYWIGGGASNEAGQAMITVRLVTRDEIDSMDPYVFRLMGRRNDNYRKRGRDVTIDVSTVKLDKGSLISGVIDKSTDARVHYGCPYCGRFVNWQWEHIEFDRETEIGAGSTAMLRCPHHDCRAEISENDRTAMLKLSNSRLVMRGQTVTDDGQVTGPLPQVATWGITWTALDSPFVSLASLATEWWKANEDIKLGDPSAMRSFYRDRLARVYKDDTKIVELTAKRLEDISTENPFSPGTVPSWGEFLSLGCDVQLRWIYWWVEAYDRTMRSHLVAAGTEVITHLDGSEIAKEEIPTRAERYAAFKRIDQLLDNGFEREGGGDERVPVLLRTTDVGYLQDDCRFWLKDNPNWNAVKGVGDEDVDQPASRSEGEKLDVRQPWYEARLQRDDYGEWTLWFVTGDLIKPYIQNGYLLRGGPRSRTLPNGLKAHSAVCRHLVSEGPVDVRGRKRWKKKTANAPNHFLDGAVYAAAMARAHIAVAYPETPPPPTSQPPPAKPLADADQEGRATTFSRRHSRIARRR